MDVIYRDKLKIHSEIAKSGSIAAREYAESIWPNFNGQAMASHTFSDGSKCVYHSWCLAYALKDDYPENIGEVVRKLLHKWNCDMELIAKQVPSHESLIWRQLPLLTDENAINGDFKVAGVKLYARFGFRNYDISSIEGVSISHQGQMVELLNG